MASTPIDQAASLLREQIRTLDEERQKLEQALSALTGASNGARTTRRSTRGPTRGARRSSRGRKRAPRGRRQAQVITYLEANPGAGPSQIAKAIGTSPNNVHAALRKGRGDKMIRKQRGGGYALTAAAKAAASGSSGLPDG